MAGFIAQLQKDTNIPWNLVGGFTAAAAMGMVAGSMLRQRIDGSKLKGGFGYLVLSVAVGG